MADPGSFASAKINAGAAKKALAELDKDFERATMYGIRAAGRVGKQTAKRAAPIYDGDDLRAEPGRLRDSIHSSKRLKKLGRNSYMLHVGPWGGVVNLYRTKTSRIHDYMGPAHRELQGRMGDQFEKAYTRVLEKRGRL